MIISSPEKMFYVCLLFHKNISCSTLTLPAYSLRYVPRREREDQERDSIPMNNGMSNTNFKGDTEF